MWASKRAALIRGRILFETRRLSEEIWYIDKVPIQSQQKHKIYPF